MDNVMGVNLSDLEDEIDEISDRRGIQNFAGPLSRDDNKNAFAHAYASAVISMDHSRVKSTFLGGVREVKSVVADKYNRAMGNPTDFETFSGVLRDGQRDMFNNNIGLEIADYAKSRNLSRNEIESLTVDALNQGLFATDLFDSRITAALAQNSNDIDFNAGTGV